jgi:hypothetical protein
VPRYGPCLGGGAPVGCNRRNLRSCGAGSFGEVAARLGALLRSRGVNAWVGGGPMDDVRPLPPRGRVGPSLVVVGVGPPQMWPVFILHDLGV